MTKNSREISLQKFAPLLQSKFAVLEFRSDFFFFKELRLCFSHMFYLVIDMSVDAAWITCRPVRDLLWTKLL